MQDDRSSTRRQDKSAAAGWWSELRNVIAGASCQLLGFLREQLGRLMHDPVAEVLGYREQLIGRMQRYYREDRAAVAPRVDRWLSRNVPQLFPNAAR